MCMHDLYFSSSYQNLLCYICKYVVKITLKSAFEYVEQRGVILDFLLLKYVMFVLLRTQKFQKAHVLIRL